MSDQSSTGRWRSDADLQSMEAGSTLADQVRERLDDWKAATDAAI
jgi:hypothetical protein